jgi:uncharacterized integral membrane protein
MQVFWIAALGFGIVIALFAAQNSTPITLRFLWLSAEGVAVSVLVLISALLGALVTALFGLGREVRMRMARRSLSRTAQAHEQRIAELANTISRLERENADLQEKTDRLQGADLLGPRAADPTEPQPLPAESPRLPLPPGER